MKNTHDAVIVGGGIIGASIAFELARRNVRALLLDRQEPGQEASWAAAGMLSPAPDSAASIPLVPLGSASLAYYPQFVEAVEEASRYSVGYRIGGTLEVLFHGDAARALSTLVTLHHGLGLACEPLSVEDAREMEPGLGCDAEAAALLPNECCLDPRALFAAVLAAAKAHGATIRGGVEIVSLLREGACCVGVRTASGESIPAAQVIIAAGCWSSRFAELASYAPTVPIRGQMLALRHTGTPLRRVLRSDRGFYVVPRNDGSPQTLVAGATQENAGYEKRVTSGGLAQILEAVNELAPELAGAEVTATWSGLRPGTPDQLPILGPADLEGLLLATGHFRNGILLAPITAKLIAEWVTEGHASFDCERFSPLRFARENAPL